MKNKKVLLTTVFTGYNYGSSLQALAGMIFLNSLGLDCKLVARKSLIRGRNIQLWKLIIVVLRSMLVSSKGFTTFQKQYGKAMIGNSSARFIQFEQEYLRPHYLPWHELKHEAANCMACFAGSDQIWNSSALYVDPLYYLRFAPAAKRIAFAPSFGRDFVADYNRKKMSKYISDFACLSVREDSGIKLIKELTGRDAIHLIDPTLMVDRETWKETLGIKDKKENYILAYFLDSPSSYARKAIAELKGTLKCEVIAIPYKFDDMSFCDRVVPTGPIEFVDLVNNAKCVLTDSFHGTAFSINLHTPFYVFARNYGTAHSQNNRIESILRMMKMQDRFEPNDIVGKLNSVNFEEAEQILDEERSLSKKYVINSIENIRSYT